MLETPIESKGGVFVEGMPVKADFYIAQAPQTFTLGEVIKAHEDVRASGSDYEGIVDTCTLMKRAGHQVALVKGPKGNIKVTTPEDLFLFRAMIQYKESENIFGFSPKEVAENLRKY